MQEKLENFIFYALLATNLICMRIIKQNEDIREPGNPYLIIAIMYPLSKIFKKPQGHRNFNVNFDLLKFDRSTPTRYRKVLQYNFNFFTLT